jgi:hypothetical protein
VVELTVAIRRVYETVLYAFDVAAAASFYADVWVCA